MLSPCPHTEDKIQVLEYVLSHVVYDKHSKGCVYLHYCQTGA